MLNDKAGNVMTESSRLDDSMNTNAVHQRSDAFGGACVQVQELLASCGIGSVRLSPTGDEQACFVQGQAPFQGQLSGCEHCRRDALAHLQDEPAYTLAEAEAWPCPAGHLMLAVPIRQRRDGAGVLLCCLAGLHYEKSEALERFCSCAGVDTGSLVSQTLGDAVSGPKLAHALSALIERLVGDQHEVAENHKEIVALCNSLAQSYEELALLHRISAELTVTQSPVCFFTKLCEEIQQVLEAQRVLALWKEPEGEGGANQLARVSSSDRPHLDEKTLELLWRRIQDVDDVPGVLIDSNVDGPYVHDWPGNIESLVAVPIRRGSAFVGAIVAFNKITKADFDSSDTKLLMSVANETAVYLNNFRLYKEMEDLFIGSLRALTSSIDAKDPYTRGHSERVALISRYLAEQVGLESQEVDNMYLAGLLHDVGKIGVPEAVLCKPGSLDAAEFAQISRHPHIGANILSGIRRMADVTPAVLTHHERYDGSGYPQGLRNQDIPRAGRIVMLADSFDAMTSDRTYRDALPVPSALAELRRFAGTQFDPHLVDAFLHADMGELVGQLAELKDRQQLAGPFACAAGN